MRFPTIVLTIAAAVAFLTAQWARADFIFGEPMRVQAAVYSDDDIDCFSYDGLEMYIASTRAGGQGNWDFWVLKRKSKDEAWGPPENLGLGINSPQEDSFGCISADGLAFYFSSNRPGGYGSYDIYMATRATKASPWGQAVNLGPTINGPAVDGEPWISPDGLELYFESYRGGGYGSADIYVSRRATAKDPWGPPVNLGAVVNSPYSDQYQSLSPDGRRLLFCEHPDAVAFRPGGYGGSDLWMARRATLAAPWEKPVNLGPIVNSPKIDAEPRIAPDGRFLYWYSTRSGGFDLWEAAIIPQCDFNADAKVDEKDVQIMTQYWGQDYPLCDIGPVPWGDGVVDEKDMTVLMKEITGKDLLSSPLSHALEIPRDAILSWTSPRFAATHDVYFGTSREDVSNASRGNPRGVLVSMGQTMTTYDPPGSLVFGQAYYWRIDEVGPGPDFTIYKGPVLDFQTEVYAYPVATRIIATASSAQNNMGPEKTVDGSGLDKNDGHSTEAMDMWLSTGAAPNWIQYQFDTVYALHELWVWNSNQPVEAVLGFGARNVKIEYSADGTTWTPLNGVPEFARAPGQAGYTAHTTVSFGGVTAKYVRLTIEKNWGATSATGLSEVRFFYLPVHASEPTPASGGKGVDVDATLTWRAGREAVSHRVYFATDRPAVANGTAPLRTVDKAMFDPGPLDLGKTYYWRIDEVNESKTPGVRQGEVWSFTTKEYVVVDDFESYTDQEGSQIYQTWIDGVTDGRTGSVAGNLQPPFAEQMVVHGGKQSMPLMFNNTRSPFYSEAERTLSPTQNWTRNGANTLTLCFRGNPLDFLQRPDGSIQMSGGGADIWGTSDQFRFACKQLNGDGTMVTKIHSLAHTDPWAKAGVMIRGTLDAASTYAFMTVTPEGRRAFQNRTTFAGSAQSAHSNPGAVSFPVWVKVERKGAYLTGYHSQDGKNWSICQPDGTDLASNSSNPVRTGLASDVYIGLAVTSHRVGVPTIAEFSDVSFTGTVTGGWRVAALGVEQPSNDPAPLYVTVEDSAGHATSLSHPEPAAVQTPEWQPWMIPLSDLAGVNLVDVKKLTIGVGNRDNPKAGGTGTIYLDDIGFGHPLSAN